MLFLYVSLKIQFLSFSDLVIPSDHRSIFISGTCTSFPSTITFWSTIEHNKPYCSYTVSSVFYKHYKEISFHPFYSNPIFYIFFYVNHCIKYGFKVFNSSIFKMGFSSKVLQRLMFSWGWTTKSCSACIPYFACTLLGFSSLALCII